MLVTFQVDYTSSAINSFLYLFRDRFQDSTGYSAELYQSYQVEKMHFFIQKSSMTRDKQR